MSEATQLGGKKAYCLPAWPLKTRNHRPGPESFHTVLQNSAVALEAHRLTGIPGPAYLTRQFSARSSRIALVTHRFRWDRRPKNFSYLKKIPWGGQHGTLR